MKKSLITMLMAAGLVSATWAQTIINTGFTTGDGYANGDLAGQANWLAVANTGTNAFDIIDASNRE